MFHTTANLDESTELTYNIYKSESDIPTDYFVLKQLIRESLYNKRVEGNLNTLLKENLSIEVKGTIENTEYPSYLNVFIHHLLKIALEAITTAPGLTDQDIKYVNDYSGAYSNITLPSGKKFTRFLKKAFSLIQTDVLETELVLFFQSYPLETRNTLAPTVDNFLANYLVKPKNDTVIIGFSIDPKYILFPNRYISGTSCFNHNGKSSSYNTGEYYNSTVNFMLHPQLIYIYIRKEDEPEKFLTRSYMFLDIENKRGLQLVLYGNRDRSLAKLIRKSLYNILGWESGKMLCTHSISTSKIIDYDSHTTYLDDSSAFRLKHEEVSDFESFYDLSSYPAICLHCGQVTDTAEGGVCSECNEEKPHCCACGEIHHVDDIFYSDDGESYCESCYNEYFAFCSDCNEYHSVDNTIYSQSMGTSLCLDCFNDTHLYCDNCCEYYLMEDMRYSEIHGLDLCNHCYADMHTHCLECSEEIEADETYCDDCANNNEDSEEV